MKGCTQPNISNVQAAFLEYLQRNVLWPRVSDQGTVGDKDDDDGSIFFFI